MTKSSPKSHKPHHKPPASPRPVAEDTDQYEDVHEFLSPQPAEKQTHWGSHAHNELEGCVWPDPEPAVGEVPGGVSYGSVAPTDDKLRVNDVSRMSAFPHGTAVAGVFYPRTE